MLSIDRVDAIIESIIDFQRYPPNSIGRAAELQEFKLRVAGLLADEHWPEIGGWINVPTGYFYRFRKNSL